MSRLDILEQLDRAHRMSCSDPSRETLYGEAAKAIREARAQAKHGVVKSPEWGWWALAETVGDVETIGPETTRVGAMISHKGQIYTLEEVG